MSEKSKRDSVVVANVVFVLLAGLIFITLAGGAVGWVAEVLARRIVG